LSKDELGLAGRVRASSVLTMSSCDCQARQEPGPTSGGQVFRGAGALPLY